MKFTSLYTETSRTHTIKMNVHTCFVMQSYLSNKNKYKMYEITQIFWCLSLFPIVVPPCGRN